MWLQRICLSITQGCPVISLHSYFTVGMVLPIGNVELENAVFRGSGDDSMRFRDAVRRPYESCDAESLRHVSLRRADRVSLRQSKRHSMSLILQPYGVFAKKVLPKRPTNSDLSSSLFAILTPLA